MNRLLVHLEFPELVCRCSLIVVRSFHNRNLEQLFRILVSIGISETNNDTLTIIGHYIVSRNKLYKLLM